MDKIKSTNLTAIKTRIGTASIEDSLKFYSEFIGLTVLEQWSEDGDKGAILGLSPSEGGQAFLELGHDDEPKKYEGVSIQIRVNSLDEVLHSIRGNVNFSEPAIRPWGSKYIYLLDPSGVTVILYEGKL